jgi:tripartite-type tricarboxylate transporter receptor subunit TctC
MVLMTILLTLIGWAGIVASQPKYPNRAIEIIVPFSAGGGQDLTARITAAYLNKKWEIPVNVVNKPGGNTIPANLELYRAAPDGYTVYADGATTCFLAVRKLPFDLLERTFVATSNMGPQILFVPSSTPFKNLKDVARALKENPETFSWASLGGPSTTDFQIIQFIKEAGIDVQKTKPIMSQGVSQCVILVAGGNAMLGSGSGTAALPALKAGTIRALAVSGTERYIDLPEVPTSAEAGFPKATVDNWFGISGPPKLPQVIVDTWNQAFQEMLKDPDVISKLRNIWQRPYYHNSRQMREMAVKLTTEIKEVWSAP